MSLSERIAAGSIAVGLLVLALKVLAWRLTGSVALMSDALESTVNVATAVAAMVAIRIAQRPPDHDHPYGHHKAEFFSAVLEGVMIILAALLILRAAWQAVQAPVLPETPGLGLAINAGAGCLNAVWAYVLITRGRRLRSPALLADGQHLFSDVLTSIGVIAGVGLAFAFRWPVLDPALAALVALNILWSGWRVMAKSLSGLMDEAVEAERLQEIRAVISASADGAIEAHDLRTRHAGSMIFIDFHLVVAGQIPVAEAHAICDRIEQALKKILPDAQITIHVEPEEKAKHSGVLVL
jgi:cation diffusion facilitator family transporter